MRTCTHWAFPPFNRGLKNEKLNLHFSTSYGWSARFASYILIPKYMVDIKIYMAHFDYFVMKKILVSIKKKEKLSLPKKKAQYKA